MQSQSQNLQTPTNKDRDTTPRVCPWAPIIKRKSVDTLPSVPRQGEKGVVCRRLFSSPQEGSANGEN